MRLFVRPIVLRTARACGVAFCITAGFLHAQEQVEPILKAEPTSTKAKITREDNLRMRYDRGRMLDEQGRWSEALQVFLGILREAPEARGSLLMAGIVLNKMARYSEAVAYLERFRKLEPQDFRGVTHLIQARQGLKDEAAVAALRAELVEMRKRQPAQEGLAGALSYRRERIPLSQQEGGAYMAILEFFEPDLPPFVEWFGDVYNGEGMLQRRFLLGYESSEITVANGKKERIRSSDAMILGEVKTEQDEPKEFIVFERLEARPSYAEARAKFLQLLQRTPEPLARVTVNP
ncbi:MAG: tetratricopeptide repeat protein [Methylacidiphilales bacterium]|nr:tetratricopeptide repeat protein [Candidatus Methylacidiphilales bacterium]MDW8349387.1 tetratricopeptide repeat protein [Verrucomicrobiae bacterium]